MVKGVVIDGKRIDRNFDKAKASKPVAKRNLSRKEMQEVKGQRQGEKAKRNDKKLKMAQKQKTKERDERRKRFMPHAEGDTDKKKSSSHKRDSDGRHQA